MVIQTTLLKDLQSMLPFKLVLIATCDYFHPEKERFIMIESCVKLSVQFFQSRLKLIYFSIEYGTN